MKDNMKTFKILCTITSLLFLFLSLQLLFNTSSFIEDMGLKPAIASLVVGRRASILMLGLSVLLFISRNLKDPAAIKNISVSTGVTMIGLASMGTYEYFTGSVNSSIFVSIIIESVLGLSFLFVLQKDLKAQNI